MLQNGKTHTNVNRALNVDCTTVRKVSKVQKNWFSIRQRN